MDYVKVCDKETERAREREKGGGKLRIGNRKRKEEVAKREDRERNMCFVKKKRN